MYDIALSISQNFMDDFIDTFDEEEFLLWLSLGDQSEKTFDLLEERLKELEYYEKLLILNKYRNGKSNMH